MGEFEDYIIIDIEERKPLLFRNSTNSEYGHARNTSYGAISSLSYSLDSERLLQLLPPTEETDLRKCQKEKSNNFAGSLYRQPTPEEVESGITSPCSLPDDTCSTMTFTEACEQQVSFLLEFVSTNLDTIEQEMNKYKEQQRERTTRIRRISTISHDDREEGPDESDTASIGGDSGIDENDDSTSHRRVLSHIKDAVLTLKSNLESSMVQLDEMVGLYDERTQGNSATMVLFKHNQQRELLREKLEHSLVQIDQEFDLLTEKDDDFKIRVLTFKKAKSESLDFLGIISFLLLLSTMSVLAFLSVYYPDERWVIVLRLLRSPLVINLYLFLYGFNIMAWARANIDYITIFGYPTNGIPTPKIIFRIASLFTLLFTSLPIVCIMSNHHVLYITDKVSSLLTWVILLLLLINPLNIMIRSGRFSFILVIVRILMSPFPEVKFGDFWFAAQLNSMVALMLDVQYTICYVGRTDSWASTWNKDTLKTCISSTNGVRPIISCLPSLWRLFQCIRCFQKTRKIAHIINAVKYFTTFPVVVFAAIFAKKFSPSTNLYQMFQDVGWVIFAWSISSIVHSLYTFVLDIVIDWGLFKGKCLRSELYYSRWKYYVATLIDFFIRFACALKLTLAIVYHIDFDVIFFFLIVAEVLRRWVWNFFRIEYEQICLERNNRK